MNLTGEHNSAQNSSQGPVTKISAGFEETRSVVRGLLGHVMAGSFQNFLSSGTGSQGLLP